MRDLYVIGNAFVRLCLFRIGPQDLPASTAFLGLVLFLNFIVNIAIATSQPKDPFTLFQALMVTAVQIVLMVFLIGLLLYIAKYRYRILQTLTAFAGADSFFGILTLPLFMLIDNNMQNSQWIKDLSILIFAALSVWNLMVFSHIFRHALNVTYTVGLLITFLYTLYSLILTHQLVPLPQ